MSEINPKDVSCKKCTKCGEFKSLDEFYKSPTGKFKRVSRCKECFRLYQREYQEELRLNNEKYKEYKEYQKEYRKNNLDRLRKQKAECARIWQRKPAKYTTYKDKLTSLESPRKGEGGILEVRCATCREYFIPSKQNVQNRIDSLYSSNRRGECRLYCSEECKTSCSVYNQKKYPKDLTKPIKREYSKEFREMILGRDEYTCQVCGERFDSKELQAHHINPVVCSPMEQLDIENGICVCKECHKKLHDQDGCRYHELRDTKK
jgi:5-methylcytosine-specific restriction endonuclease McrA